MVNCETEQDGCLQEKNPAWIPHYFLCYVDQNLSKEQSDNFLIQELFFTSESLLTGGLTIY